MGLSNRHAVACSVLALALVALLVDRFVLNGGGGPAAATAAPPDAYAVTTVASPPAMAPVAQTSLAQRLRVVARELEHSSPNDTTDIFGTPAMWRKPTGESNASPAVSAESSKEPPLPPLKLSSIVGSTHAVINGRGMTVGTALTIHVSKDQAVAVELLSVDPKARQVVVRVLGREVTLQLNSSGSEEPERIPGT